MAKRGRRPRKPRGRHPHNKLTDLMVRKAKPGRHSDGLGMQLLVRENGYKSYVQRLTIKGKRCDLGLGPCSAVTLREAREKALENYRLVRDGGDPRKDPVETRVPALGEIVESVITIRRPRWKTEAPEAEFRRLFGQHVYGTIPADTPIDEIKVKDLLPILEPIWTTTRSKGYILYQHLSVVMRSAIAHGYRADDPAVLVKQILPPAKSSGVHHASLPYQEAPEALARVLASDADEPVKLFIVFTVLTGARFSEASDAVWSEIGKVDGHPAWLPRSERMKSGNELNVPLASQALEVLSAARRLAPQSSYIFCLGARSGRSRKVTDVLRSLNLVDERGRPVVMHGFRATFRVWMQHNQIPFEVCEAALGHAQKDKTVAAYARSDVFDVRVPLMQRWADFLFPQGLSC